MMMPYKNVFEGLGEMESFALNVFIDLSLDDQDGDNEWNLQGTSRTRALINEARKLLASSDIDADALFAEWKRQGEEVE